MTDKQFQRLIDRLVKINERHYRIETTFLEECKKRFGCSPSDISCDWIIDAVLGGCGAGVHITVQEVTQEMETELKRCGGAPV